MRDNEYRNEYDSEFDNLQTAGGGSLRWISMLVMAMVIFGFFSLVFYAYNSSVEMNNDDLIPTITAEGDDYKIKPEDAGGMPIENTDIEAYQLMRKSNNPAEEADQVEKLLPLAERPIVRDMNGNPELLHGELQKMQNTENNVDTVTNETPNAQVPALLPQEQKIPQAVNNEIINAEPNVDLMAEDNIDAAINDVLQKQAAQMQDPLALQNINNSNQQVAENKSLKPVIKTITAQPTINAPAIIQPEPQTNTETKLALQQTEEAVIQAPAPAPAPANIKLENQQIEQMDKLSTIQPSTDKKVIAPQKPIIQNTPKPQINNNDATTYIQFAAMRSNADAPKVWAALKAKNPELNNYSYYTEAVTLPTGTTLYRLRAKGFANRSQALNVCNTVKARGQDCLVSSN